MRRAIAEPRDAFSCTANFNHSGHRGTRRKSVYSGGSTFLRTAADDFSIENCGESNPGSVWDESVGGGAIDFPCGSNVGRDRSFERQDVGQRELRSEERRVGKE